MQKTSVELRQARAELISTAKYIADKAKKDDRVLNDEEIVETGELTGEAAKLEELVKKTERAEQAMEDIDNLSASTLVAPEHKPAPEITHGTARSNDDQTFTIPATYRRCSPLKCFKGPQAERDAYVAGMWMLATIYKNRRADLWCQRHGVYEQLAQSEGVASEGGNLTPDVLSQVIIDSRNSFGIARQHVRIYPMSSDVMDIPKVSGSIVATFGGESTTIDESDKAWIQVKLTAKRLGIITRASKEVTEDSIIDLVDDLALEHARALALKEDEVIFSGDSSPDDGGITGITTLFEANTGHAGFVRSAGDNFDEVTDLELTNLMAALPAYALPNAKWYVSSAGYHAVFVQNAATVGGNTFVTMADGATRLGYLGYPVVIQNTFAQGATTDYSNSVMLLFGDLSQSIVLGDRRGIRMDVSDAPYWAQDQIAIKSTERIDVAVHNIGDATDAGPVVALAGIA